MTMVSTEIGQLLSGRNDGYYSHNCVEEAALIGSDLVVNDSIILMAEEQSSRDDQHREKSDSRSDHAPHQDHERDKDWLQLSIGCSRSQDPTTDQITSSKDSSSRIELALMPRNNISPNYHSIIGPSQEFRAPRPAIMNNYAALFSQQLYPHDDAANSWGFRPHLVLTSIATSSSPCPSSSSSFTANPSSRSMAARPSNYIRQPFQVYFGSSLDMIRHQAPAGMDFRVVQPPRRPHSGLWFMLQASQNQEKEPYLPQIPKKYLRIKDGKMTIRLVMKYLVNKLKLENESEVEIICKGQKVLPFLTMQHVRDKIWSSYNSSRDFITLPPDSSTNDHIMVLHYGRISSPHTSN